VVFDVNDTKNRFEKGDGHGLKTDKVLYSFYPIKFDLSVGNFEIFEKNFVKKFRNKYFEIHFFTTRNYSDFIQAATIT
jgi:hypothetical protein